MLYVEALRLKKAELEERRKHLEAKIEALGKKTEADVAALYADAEAKAKKAIESAEAIIGADRALVVKLNEKIARIEYLISDEEESMTPAVTATPVQDEVIPEHVEEEAVAPGATDEAKDEEVEPVVIRYGIGGK